jgi:hypothetical protein
MKKKTSRRTLSQLVGRWTDGAGDSSAVFKVAVEDGRPVVSGVDESDGERFRVSGVKWDGSSLTFVAYMPSTRWRVSHRFVPLGRGVINHELKYTERWKRVAPGTKTTK